MLTVHTQGHAGHCSLVEWAIGLNNEWKWTNIKVEVVHYRTIIKGMTKPNFKIRTTKIQYFNSQLNHIGFACDSQPSVPNWTNSKTVQCYKKLWNKPWKWFQFNAIFSVCIHGFKAVIPWWTIWLFSFKQHTSTTVIDSPSRYGLALTAIQTLPIKLSYALKLTRSEVIFTEQLQRLHNGVIHERSRFDYQHIFSRRLCACSTRHYYSALKIGKG